MYVSFCLITYFFSTFYVFCCCYFTFFVLQTVRFKNELERNITIKLGYANAKVCKWTHFTLSRFLW